MDVFLICMLWLLLLIVFLILTQNDKKAAEALKKSKQAELPYFKQINTSIYVRGRSYVCATAFVEMVEQMNLGGYNITHNTVRRSPGGKTLR
jgi:hypothetical protein